MAELLGLFLVGLSLFFQGVGGIKLNLQGLTSRRLRRQLARWSMHPALAGACGFLFGAITQSSTAVAFILSGLVSNNLLVVSQALPVLAWANLGTVLLVFCASLNLHLAFLYLLGLAGLALAFDLGSIRLRPLLSALFSAGLLFFGLQMMKDAFGPLPRFPWFGEVAAFLQGSALAAFAAGCLLRLVIQSSSGIAVIAIALAHGGLLSSDQAAMMMYGTGVGVGLSVFLLSAHLQGVARQIALYQALINSFSGLTLGALYYVEEATGWPLAIRAAGHLAHSEGLKLAFAFLFLQATTVAVSLVTSRFAAGWLARLAPPTEEQELSRPHFLTESALADPESALDLADREQQRLLGFLPAQLDTIREEAAATAPLPSDTLHRAAVAVGAEVLAFLGELMDHPGDRSTTERLLALERRQSLLASLDESVSGFVETWGKLRPGADPVGPLLDNLAESLNTLLLTAADLWAGSDDSEILVRLTADRGEMMERLRRSLLTSAPSLDAQQKAHLFYLTSLFERTIWLLHQVGLARQSLDPGALSVRQS